MAGSILRNPAYRFNGIFTFEIIFDANNKICDATIRKYKQHKEYKYMKFSNLYSFM